MALRLAAFPVWLGAGARDDVGVSVGSGVSEVDGYGEGATVIVEFVLLVG